MTRSTGIARRGEERCREAARAVSKKDFVPNGSGYAGGVLIADLYTTYGNGGIFYRSGKFGVLKGYEHRPVTPVTWDGAVSYCQAQGKQLPTEAD